MQKSGVDLLMLLQIITGPVTLFLPLIFAIRSKDAWAIAGVAVLLLFGMVVLAGAGRGAPSLADQMLATTVWFASMVLGVAAHYAPRKVKAVEG